MRLIPVLGAAIILTGCRGANDQPFNPAYRMGCNSDVKEEQLTLSKSQVLKEANELFTYRGKRLFLKQLLLADSPVIKKNWNWKR